MSFHLGESYCRGKGAEDLATVLIYDEATHARVDGVGFVEAHTDSSIGEAMVVRHLSGGPWRLVCSRWLVRDH